MASKHRINLDDFEYRIMVNALNELRNKLIHEGRCTIDVDELLLKIIDVPTKRRYVR